MGLCKTVFKTFAWIFISGLMVSWNLPENYQSLKNAKEDALLDYVIIEVNGESRKVNCNEEISYVRGDKVLVKGAFLKNSKKSVGFISLANPTANTKKPKDLRLKKIDPLDLIQKESALDPEGTVYGLVVQTGHTLHGSVFLHRIEPELSYIDVLINGKNHVMREGESIQVKKSDHFKVVNVITNIHENKDISFAIVPLVSPKMPVNSQKYHIIFKHKDYVFAKIPLAVENL